MNRAYPSLGELFKFAKGSLNCDYYLINDDRPYLNHSYLSMVDSIKGFDLIVDSEGEGVFYIQLEVHLSWLDRISIYIHFPLINLL